MSSYTLRVRNLSEGQLTFYIVRTDRPQWFSTHSDNEMRRFRPCRPGQKGRHPRRVGQGATRYHGFECGAPSGNSDVVAVETGSCGYVGGITSTIWAEFSNFSMRRKAS